MCSSYICVCVCVCVCVSIIGLTEHTDRGRARVGLTNQDRAKQAYIGRQTYRQAGPISTDIQRQSPVCVRVCVSVCTQEEEIYKVSLAKEELMRKVGC